MSAARIRLLVDLSIHEGKFAEFEALAKQMAAVSEREPGTLGYHFVLSADRTRCRLVEGYADVAAITAHFEGPAVQQFVPPLVQAPALRAWKSMAIPARRLPPWPLPSGPRSSLPGKASTGRPSRMGV